MLLRQLDFETFNQTGNKDETSKPKFAKDGNNETCAVTADRDNPYWKGNFTKDEEMVVTIVTLFNIGAGKCNIGFIKQTNRLNRETAEYISA